MTSRRTSPRETKAPAPSTEVLRDALAHKLAQFARDWKRCARPACARHKRCAAALSSKRKTMLSCRAAAPSRVPTPAQQARVMRALQRALTQALAARQAQDGDAAL